MHELVQEEQMPKEQTMVINELTKYYADTIVLEQLSLKLNRGEIHGILGRNGAGKTTLMECAVGLRPFEQGTVTILGMDIVTDRKRIIKQTGIQPQEASLFPRITVQETLQLFASFYGDANGFQDIMDMLELGSLKGKKVKSLSSGQKQRLLVALSLIGNPSFVMLDEPTTGLDPQVRQLIWQVLRYKKSQNKSILLSTHSMEEAEKICDRISILHDRKIIVTGTPEEIIEKYRKTRSDTLEDVFLLLTGKSLRGEMD